jgi:hypothetical protein
VLPIVLPAWSLDGARGNCTTLTLLGPPSTQFVVQLHPWPGLPGAVASSAGALQLTRCGKDRVSLVEVRVEMRSPRALLYSWAAVGNQPPPALPTVLPERDAGASALALNPGPAPERDPLATRLQRFEAAARGSGASAVESLRVPSVGLARVTLEPGCHRWLASAEDPSPAASLLVTEADDQSPLRIEPEDSGDLRYELCTLRTRKLTLALDAGGADLEKTLVVAHYGLPGGLPERFGPELGERLLQALGGSAAPRKLGTLVFASLGAQGLTPLPRTLLPGTCYVAALVTIHGSAQTLSLGARAGALNVEASVNDARAGTHVGFCTDKDALAQLEVEARGLGVAWLVAIFQLGRARPEGS